MADTTRTRILEGVVELLQSQRGHDLSMEEVAQWIGVSRKTLYNHFENRTDLVNAALHTRMEQIVERLAVIAADRSCDLVSRLNNLVNTGFRDMRFFWDAPGGGRSFLDPAGIRDTARTLDTRLREVIQSLVEEGAAAGLLADGVEPGFFARLVSVILAGVRALGEEETESRTRTAFLRDSLRVTLSGALSDRGRTVLRDAVILELHPAGGISEGGER